MTFHTAYQLLTGTKKFDHINTVLKILYWIAVEKRIDLKVLLIVYYALHDQAPEYVRDKFWERTNI